MLYIYAQCAKNFQLNLLILAQGMIQELFMEKMSSNLGLEV